MIQLRNITKKYARSILDSITLDFEYGNLYVLKGVSGCGKTTLLNIIGGLLHTYEGEYYFNGELVTGNRKIREKLNECVSYVFQESLLFSGLTIMENLCFVYNDASAIREYSDKLKVTHLLDKMPEQLSNGERQRFSIIRALLKNPSILIADEPTASLDTEMSIEIRNIFDELKNENLILIIATHENCFDDIADKVISLDYGKIEKVFTQTIQEVRMPFHNKLASKSNKRCDMHYSLARSKKITTKNFLLYTIIFLFILLSLSVRMNFDSAYQAKLYTDYPYRMQNGILEESDKKLPIQIYDDYQFEENKVYHFGLFDKQYSSFSVPNAIAYGTFPKSKNEVLINEMYAKEILKSTDEKDILNKSILIRGDKYLVSGVITSDESIKEHIYYSNEYLENNNAPQVFIPYESIRKYEEITPHEQVMFAYEGDTTSSEFESLMSKYGCYWNTYISDKIIAVSFFMNMFLLAVICLLVIVFVFLSNMIRLELYNRKKEIGFMRLFSIDKRRIRFIIFLQFSNNVFKSLLFANMIYVCICIAVFIIYSMSIHLNFITWLSIQILIISYTLVLTILPLNKFLKKPIMELIND